jgi:hypothetical protein
VEGATTGGGGGGGDGAMPTPTAVSTLLKRSAARAIAAGCAAPCTAAVVRAAVWASAGNTANRSAVWLLGEGKNVLLLTVGYRMASAAVREVVATTVLHHLEPDQPARQCLEVYVASS